LVVWPISQHLEYFTAPKGEFTILVPPADREANDQAAIPSAAELRQKLGQLTNNTATTRRQALKVLAERYGVSVNELYRLLGRAAEDGQTT
jgi:16S rRNA C1402 (ribose-2'-O) methylase RsmI